MHEFKDRFAQSLVKIKETMGFKSDQKPLQGSRHGENVLDSSVKKQEIQQQSTESKLANKNKSENTKPVSSIIFDVRTVAGRYQIIKKPDDFLE